MLAVLVVLATSINEWAAQKATVVDDRNGAISTGGGLRMVIHVSQDRDGMLTATMDSPDKGVNAVISTRFKDPAMHFEIEKSAPSTTAC